MTDSVIKAANAGVSAKGDASISPKPQGAAAKPLAAPDSGRTAPMATGDSLRTKNVNGKTMTDSIGLDSLGHPRNPADSASAKVHERQLPARTLTLNQQVMFAGGFMAFIALMMTSMQNFNP